MIQITHRWLLFWGTLALSAILLACGSGATSPSTTMEPLPEPISLSIVHTNDTWGYLRPCG